MEFERDVRARDLVHALAEHVGAPATGALGARIQRTGAWIGSEERADDLDLLDGDRLELDDVAPPVKVGRAGDGPALVDLVVVDGPAAPARVPLPAGEYVVGRSDDADVTVSDRSLSRRHLVLRVESAGVTIADLASRNGCYLDGVRVDEHREAGDGQSIVAGRSRMVVERRGAPQSSTRPPGVDGRVPFNRPPRVVAPRAHAVPAVGAPPAEPERPRAPLGAALVPLAIGGVMVALTHNPFLLSFALLTPAMVLWSYLDTRRGTSRRHRAAESVFRGDVAEAAAALREARRAEGTALHRASPDVAEVRRRIEELAPELWERRPGDEDLLRLRVGTGDRRSSVEIDPAPGGSRQLRRAAAEALDADAVLRSVPICVPLAGEVVGLAGPRRRVVALGRRMLIEAAALHSPAEVEIAAAVGSERSHAWSWLQWLPHVRADALALGDAEARSLLERLADGGSRVVVVLDGVAGVEHALLGRVARAGGAVLSLGATSRELPGTCTRVVTVSSDGASSEVTDVRTGDRVCNVAVEQLALSEADELARLLAPVQDAGARPRGGIPDRVSLLELLDLPEPTPEAVRRRWERAGAAVSAPLGVATDAPFELDVGRTDGVRLLVGGVPGSGKSELLQTLIASLAVLHPPSRLAFLLVDYKGGAAFRDAVRLPHATGLVTDLDEHLAERCRQSLHAELRRREALLHDRGARSMRDLWRLDPSAAPPALVIVVDEFAALVREVPSFVDAVLDVAQRGRSLGLHLVLATQRPRGVVSDAIKANTNVRIAMRMADPAESADIIDAGDAAAIAAGQPGRAIAMTGRAHGGAPVLTEFQAAYAGGRSTSEVTAPVRIAPLAFGRSAVAARVVSRADGGADDDLARIVEAARGAAGGSGVDLPHAPWLPPLPAALTYDELPPGAAAGPAIGIVDEPALQRRTPLTAELDADGSMLIFGASGSGKTTALQTIARALADAESPSDVWLYGLDYASGRLGVIEALPHCGSVVAGGDEERALRLVASLERLLDDRKRDRRVHAGPRVVLLLDGYGAFAAALERVELGAPVRAVTRLAAEGRALGLHVVATASRRSEVPGALFGVVPARLVLALAEPGEYAALGVRRPIAPAMQLPPGRGFTPDGTEFQVALPGGLGGSELAGTSVAGSAPPVRTLPTQVRQVDLPAPSGRLEAVLGLEDERLAPVAVDLGVGPLLVVGGHRTGKSTTLAALTASLVRGHEPPALHLLAPRRGRLGDLDLWTSAAVGPEAVAESAERLAQIVDGTHVVVVDDATDVADGRAAAALESLLRRRDADAAVALVVAGELGAVQRLFSGWLRELRGHGRGVLLAPTAELDGDVLGARIPRPPSTGFPAGRGYLVDRGATQLVQVAVD